MWHSQLITVILSIMDHLTKLDFSMRENLEVVVAIVNQRW